MSISQIKSEQIQTVLNEITDSSIHFNQNIGPNFGVESFNKFAPFDLPLEYVQQLAKLHFLGLSKASVITDCLSLRLSNYKRSTPIKIKDLRVFDGDKRISGNDLVTHIDSKLPGFLESQAGLYQGSATKCCPNRTDVDFGKRLAQQGKYLVIGGQGKKPSNGIDGSSMNEVFTAYDNNGGKGKIVVIPEYLNVNSPHNEKVSDEKNTVILTVPNIAHRLGAFTIATTKGKDGLGEAGIGYGGNGTLGEAHYLEAISAFTEYGKLNVEYLDQSFWQSIINYNSNLTEDKNRINSKTSHILSSLKR
jgi:hypothetical protein